MATINVRQRIDVRTMGTSRPSLTGQCPPIKKEPDPIPYPHRQPPKTTNQNLRNQENCQFRTPKIEKRPRESPKGQNPDRPLIDHPNDSSEPIKSRIKPSVKRSNQACHHWETTPGQQSRSTFSFGSPLQALTHGKPTFFQTARKGPSPPATALTITIAASTRRSGPNSVTVRLPVTPIAHPNNYTGNFLN